MLAAGFSSHHQRSLLAPHQVDEELRANWPSWYVQVLSHFAYGH